MKGCNRDTSDGSGDDAAGCRPRRSPPPAALRSGCGRPISGRASGCVLLLGPAEERLNDPDPYAMLVILQPWPVLADDAAPRYFGSKKMAWTAPPMFSVACSSASRHIEAPAGHSTSWVSPDAFVNRTLPG